MAYVTDNERSFGLPSSKSVTAVEQLQRSYPRVGIQPMPAGKPGRATGQQVGIDDLMGDQIKFMVVGDSGGIMQATYQQNVVNAMIGRLEEEPDIEFVYHVGDEVYFNGGLDQYASQFYEPYAHLNRPIVGVPGNHDGSVSVDDSGNATGRLPLDTFMANFCDTAPHIPTCDQQFEYGRHTQTQPYCDWTLNLHNVTIIGLYTNVPSGGHLFVEQGNWLQEEMMAAPIGVPVIVALHHPPYSVDAHHGGSQHIGDALDSIFNAVNRWPELVMSGHVHDYQRFSRTPEGVAFPIPYIVVGNSGYHNLHRLAKDATPGSVIPAPSDGEVVFEAGDDRNWGFVVMTIGGSGIAGEYVSVAADGTAHSQFDTFNFAKER